MQVITAQSDELRLRVMNGCLQVILQDGWWRLGDGEWVSGLCNVRCSSGHPGEDCPLSARGDGGRGRPAGGAGMILLSCHVTAVPGWDFTCVRAHCRKVHTGYWLDCCGPSPSWSFTMVALSRVHYLDAYLELSCISCVCVFATCQPPSQYLAGATSNLIPLCFCVCVRAIFVFCT